MSRICHDFCDCSVVQSGSGGNCSKLFIFFFFRTPNLSSCPISILFSYLEKFPLGIVLLPPSAAFSLQELREARPSLYSLAQSYCLNLLIIHLLAWLWRLREYFGGSINSSCSPILAIVFLHSLLSSPGLLQSICFCYFQSRNLSFKGAIPWL